MESELSQSRGPNKIEASTPLGNAILGFKGTVNAIDASSSQLSSGLEPAELERRLIEMGFVEGSIVEIKHEGLWKRDPIAVKVNNTTIALRRRTANAILVSPLAPVSNECPKS